MISRTARRRIRREKVGEGRFQAHQKMLRCAKQRGPLVRRINLLDDKLEQGVKLERDARGKFVSLAQIRESLAAAFGRLATKISVRRQPNLHPAGV